MHGKNKTKGNSLCVVPIWGTKRRNSKLQNSGRNLYKENFRRTPKTLFFFNVSVFQLWHVIHNLRAFLFFRKQCVKLRWLQHFYQHSFSSTCQLEQCGFTAIFPHFIDSSSPIFKTSSQCIPFTLVTLPFHFPVSLYFHYSSLPVSITYNLAV